MSLLLPLETLPGWPEAPEVSTTWMLMLLFILPLLAGGIITLLTFTPTLARRFRGEPAPGTEVARRQQPAAPDALS